MTDQEKLLELERIYQEKIEGAADTPPWHTRAFYQGVIEGLKHGLMVINKCHPNFDEEQIFNVLDEKEG